MLYLVVINNIIGPVNLIVCASCLVLLFFESAFGICLGCKVWNLFNKDKAQLCPGGACEVIPAPGSGASLAQVAIVAAFIGLVGAVAVWVAGNDPHAAALQAQGDGFAADPDRSGRSRALQGARIRESHGPRREVEAAQQLQVTA